MKRILSAALVAAASLLAFADVTTTVSPTVDVDPACVASTTAAASAGAATVTKACPATRNVTATYTPPVVLPPTNPFPNGETQTTTCAAPSIGSYVQTRLYTLVNNAWVAGAWTPSTAPAGACTTPTPTSGVQIKTNAGLCIDAATPAAIVQQACDGTKASQIFTRVANGNFMIAGQCLGVTSATNGTQLAMMTCAGANAVWTTPSANVKNSGVAKCIDIPLSQVNVPGAIAQIWSCDVPTSIEQTMAVVDGGGTPSNPFPNGESRSVVCDAPLIGSWTQTRPYTLINGTWVGGAWTPTSAPAGACSTTPPPPPPPASGAQTVTFTQSTEDFKNPGRGFYVSPKPSEMNVTTLTNFVNYWGTRLMLYSPDLSPYRNTALPQSFLSTVNTHIAAARAAGVKLIIWPQYNSDSGGADAPINIALQHIQQLGPVWAQNADVIPFFKAGYVGAYGEWWGSQNGLDSDANKLAIKNAILANTPATSMVYIRTPGYIQKWYSTPAAASAARIGFHNDCYLANNTDASTFTGLNDPQRDYAKGLTTFGFETCDNVSNPEQMRKTCAQALSENAAYHATWGNKSYAPTFINSWTSGGCMDQISRSFGYRFFIPSVNYNATTAAGQPTTVTARVQNVGNSGLFDDRTLYVTLRNQATGALVSGPAGKLRQIAGGASATMSAVLTVPVGTYDILLSAPDPFPSLAGDVRYAVRFANADSGTQKWVAPYFQTGASIKAQ